MSYTDGVWDQGTPQTGMQIFVGASDFIDTAGHATSASSAAGLFSKNLAASLSATLFANVSSMLLRTPVYATAAGAQQQFGTAAAVPGPSAVANTSGPLALSPGYPPITAANMATVGGTVGGAGIQRGPIAKGMQITGVDVIYAVGTTALTTATLGLTKTAFANNTAPAVTNIIALGTNSLPTAAQTQPYVKNVAVASPAMITTADSEVLVNVNFTTPGSSTVVFYGVVLYVSYNLN
jgi:hypothetical protein